MITSTALLAPWAMLWVVLIRTLLVRANILPETCRRCGLPYERRWLGAPICPCQH